MSAILRWTMPLIAYLCVGTVISAVLGYGYLRSTGKLNDDTMFQIIALVHGVDLDELAKEGETTVEETPGEEPSFAEQQQLTQTATLHFDAKQKQLADSLSDFDYQLKRLSEATSRYAQLRTVVETYLTAQQQLVENAALAKVREQIEVMDARKQAKPILIEMITNGQIDQVVLLLGNLKPQIRRDILRTFNTEEDIKILYQIQSHMLNDDPAKPLIDKQLQSLQEMNAQDP
jgi:hypothetical protein